MQGKNWFRFLFRITKLQTGIIVLMVVGWCKIIAWLFYWTKKKWMKITSDGSMDRWIWSRKLGKKISLSIKLKLKLNLSALKCQTKISLFRTWSHTCFTIKVTIQVYGWMLFLECFFKYFRIFCLISHMFFLYLFSMLLLHAYQFIYHDDDDDF